MSVTAARLVADTRQRLLGGAPELRTRLSQPYTAGGTKLFFSYPVPALQAGVRVSIGLNTFYVWTVANDFLSCDVEGGHQATTDVSAAAGSTVLVRPEYTEAELFNALNDELLLLGSGAQGLYGVATVQLTANSAVRGYDLAAPGLAHVLEVTYREPGTVDPAWHVIGLEWLRLVRNAATADFPSGLGLNIALPLTNGQPIRVTYAKPYGQFTALSDTTAAVALPDSAVSLPPLGAAISLVAGKEVRRNSMEAQPDPRRAAEVPPAAIGGSIRDLMLLRQERIDAERVRLMQQWPAVLR